MLGVRKPDGQGNFGKRKVCFLHKLDRTVDPIDINIGRERDAHIIFEQPAEITDGDLKLRGDVRLPDLSHILLFNIIQGVGDIAVLVGRKSQLIRGVLVQKMQHHTDQKYIDLRIGKVFGMCRLQLEELVQCAVQYGISGDAVIKAGRKQQGMNKRSRTYAVVFEYNMGEHRGVKVNMDKGTVRVAV